MNCTNQITWNKSPHKIFLSIVHENVYNTGYVQLNSMENIEQTNEHRSFIYVLVVFFC